MSYRTVMPPAAKAMVDQGHRYVDVRTVEEFDAGHPAGAFNVPFALRDGAGRLAPNAEFLVVMRRAFKTGDKLVVGCAAGGRSAAACEALAGAGFTEVTNMHCGFGGARSPDGSVQPGWHAHGYPVATVAYAERSYAHLRGAG